MKTRFFSLLLLGGSTLLFAQNNQPAIEQNVKQPSAVKMIQPIDAAPVANKNSSGKQNSSTRRDMPQTLPDSRFVGPDNGKQLKEEPPRIARRELLTLHDVNAVFDGIIEKKCLGRTALCPDRCGHSQKVVSFTILSYNRYDKHGEYAEEKMDRHLVAYKDLNKEQRAVADHLKKGDRVRLVWLHEYLTTDNGSKFPERTVTELKKISDAPAAPEKKGIENKQKTQNEDNGIADMRL